MAEMSDGLNTDGDIFSLSEFVDCYDLPKWVEVVGGGAMNTLGARETGSCNIQKGMLLILRTLAVDSITLSFNEVDVGKRIVQVSPNTQVKFSVELPYPDFKHPKEPRTVYKTVGDLLKVCPTYFKANVLYDDPYLPAIVKAGEVFRFIRQIKRPSDRRLYLQCKDADDNLIELPAECRGDFTAVEDTESYTLKELLDLGCVDRKLKLCHDHIKLSPSENGTDDNPVEEPLYSNVTGSEASNMLQRIMGLPLSYNGLLTFHMPKMFLAASPSERQTDIWKIPLSTDIQVKLFAADEYESPCSGCELPDVSSQPPPYKVYKLSELLDTYHEDFPVLATLVHYKDMPAEFVNCLKPGSDVIIHNIERHDRLLARSGKMHFSIDRKMQGRFRKTLRKFHSIADIKDTFPDPLNEEVFIKILQDIASDFPIQYSLQSGDVLKFKTLHSKMHKVKVKSKSYGPFSIVNCEKRKESGSYKKIMIPDDLEIYMIELPSLSKAEGFSVEEVFRYKPELPLKVDYLADYTSLWSCLPVTSELELTNFVKEPIALISPGTHFDSDEPHHIDNRVRDCLLVPARHQMMLTVKQCLGFPQGYFMFPDKSVFIECPVEKTSRDSYDELIRHNDLAYEDYDPESPLSANGVALPTRYVSKLNTSPTGAQYKSCSKLYISKVVQ